MNTNVNNNIEEQMSQLQLEEEAAEAKINEEIRLTHLALELALEEAAEETPLPTANDIADMMRRLAGTPVSNHPRTINIRIGDATKYDEIEAQVLELQSGLRRYLASQIVEYVRRYVAGVQQRTPEWVERKLTTVGGSSIATLMNLNRFESIGSFILGKIGLGDSYTANTATAWGNMFEEIIQEVVEANYDTKIVGTDIYIEDGNIGLSPDGMGIVTQLTHHEIGGGGNDGSDTAAVEHWIQASCRKVLFEFKCPYSRLPTKDAPPYYVPQVQLSLEHIRANDTPLLDIGILAEGVFRICTLADLSDDTVHNQTINKSLYQKEYKPPVNPRVIAMGIIGLYGTAPEHCKSIAESAELDLIDRYYEFDPTKRFLGTAGNGWLACDLGNADAPLFDALMAAINSKHLCYTGKETKVWYSKTAIRSAATTAEEAPAKQARAANFLAGDEVKRFRQDCQRNGQTIYGVLPWKLLDIRYHEIERRDPPILEEFGGVIDETIGVIRDCLAAPLSQRLAMYNEYMMSKNGGGFI